MTKVLKSSELKSKLKKEISEKLKKMEEIPSLAIIRVGKKEEDLSYEKSIIKAAKEVGIDVEIFVFDNLVETNKILSLIKKLNTNKKVKGILVFKPLPKNINEKEIEKTIDPKKDVDCINPINKSKIFEGDMSGFISNAPKAAIELMEHYGYSLNKKVLIINRSEVIGKPLLMLLLKKDATVTIAHSNTKNLKELTKSSDYVFTAIGKTKCLDKSFFTKESVIIDMGISIDENGKISGDLDTKSIFGYVKAYTPVPGGIGPITNLLLLKSILY